MVGFDRLCSGQTDRCALDSSRVAHKLVGIDQPNHETEVGLKKKRIQKDRSSPRGISQEFKIRLSGVVNNDRNIFLRISEGRMFERSRL